MKRVVVTGSLAYDHIMDFPGRFSDRIVPDKIHRISLAPIVDKFTKQFGGTAGNVAYTLKLLDIEPLVVAPAGNDFTEYRKFLNKHKISTSSIRIFKNEPMGMSFMVADRDDNQIGAFYQGALKYAERLSIRKLTNDFIVIGPTTPKAMKKYIKECLQLKLAYLYDPAFQIGDFTADELLEGVSGAKILIGNDYEIALIEQKLGTSHEELLSKCPIIITTLGSKGSIIENQKDAINIKPAKPKNTSDPTGAGDAYRAGFVAGYLRGFDLLVCGQMGSVAATYTVEKYGTVTHYFTKKEFEKRYYDNYGTRIHL